MEKYEHEADFIAHSAASEGVSAEHRKEAYS